MKFILKAALTKPLLLCTEILIWSHCQKRAKKCHIIFEWPPNNNIPSHLLQKTSDFLFNIESVHLLFKHSSHDKQLTKKVSSLEQINL